VTDAPSADSNDVLAWLQWWYADQCDGDWEHGEGVAIGTLDNPGWRVEIDIEGTPLEGRAYERTKVERTDQDWLHSWLDGVKWHAAGGPLNLAEALALFQAWARSD